MSSLTWEAARNWLVSSGQLESKCTSLVELAAALQNGKVLCDVANSIRPGSIQRVHVNPTHQFMAFDNINAFRAGCTSFGVANHLIFESDELFHATNFERVLLTISTLSHTDIARRRGLRPFPDQPYRPTKKTEEEQKIYESLEDIMEQGNLAKIRARTHMTSKSPSRPKSLHVESSTDDMGEESSDDELDYDDMFDFDVEAEDVYQTLVRSRPRKKVSSLNNLSEKAQYIFEELIGTEQSYVAGLKLIIDYFRIPLERQQTVVGVTPGDIGTVFSNVDEIYQMQTRFLKTLEEAPGVGRVILKYKHDFLIYAKYCSSLPDALARLETLNKKPKFVSFLKTAVTNSRQRFELKDLLSLPMQRILKYPLLIKDFQKHNTQSQGLGPALRSLQDLAKFINEVKRDHDNMAVVNALQSSLKDYNIGSPGVVPLINYGRYMLDGDLKLKAEYESRAVKRYVFLFQKAFVICKPKASSNHFLYTMNIRDFQIEDEWVRGKNVGIKLSSRLPSAIAFNCTMIFKSEPIKMEWLHAIFESKQSLSPEIPKGTENTHHFTLTTFSEPTSCQHCFCLLWGQLNQGFQCEGCGANLHKSCIGAFSPHCPSKLRAGTLPRSAGRAIRARPPTVIDEDDSGPVLAVKRSFRGKTSSQAPARPVQAKPIQPAKLPMQEVYVAVYDYVDHHERSVGDLAFHAGDEIIVLEKTSQNWWTGRLRDGTTGVVPATFLMPKPKEEVQVRSSTFSTATMSPARTSQSVRARSKPSFDASYGNSAVDALVFTNTYKNDESLAQATIADEPAKAGHTYINLNRRSASVVHHGKKGHRNIWFMGIQSRDDADERLANAPDGAFLVRESTRRPGEYSVSLKFQIVKHIKVYNDQGYVHISLKKRFASIPDLVEYYRNNSLSDHFPQLTTKLRHPMGLKEFPLAPQADMGVVTALFDFVSESPDELAFVKGDQITLLSTEGCGEGWWKGQLRGVTGVFPSSYVAR